MNAFALLMSLIAVLATVIIVYFQYYYRQKITRDSVLLSFFRFVSILCILLILIKPKFESSSTVIVKPKLFVLSDNSSSIAHNKVEDQLRILVGNIQDDEDLHKRFDLSSFRFGNNLSADTVMDFNDEQTNIYKAVNDVNSLIGTDNAAMLLLTDGIQTYGNNYAFMASKTPVFPLVFGDTLMRPDIEITRVNVNAYTNLDNNFPVEVFVNSNMNRDLNTKLIVQKNNETVYSAPVSFSSDKASERLSFFLPADSIGMHLYKTILIPFEGELNTRNNSKRFGVEVLDEQAVVAIVYSVLHPDVGMIKRSIESNRQRKVKLIYIDDIKEADMDHALYIIYQPNSTFSDFLNSLKSVEQNLFIITGSETDWDFLNKIDLGFAIDDMAIIENLFPVFQNDFNSFYVEDINFNSYPPLSGSLANVSFNTDHQFLLTRRISDIKTGEPLLATFSNGETKNIVLLGEDIWKWRSHSLGIHGSFEKFDQFFNSLIQFLQLADRKSEMDLFYEPVYQSKESIKIRVKKYDSNLGIELNSKLVLKLNEGVKEIPLYINGDSYEVQLENLTEGNYIFEVKDLDSGKKKAGSFSVVPFSIEEENLSPNIADLSNLAQNSNGRLFYQDQFEELKGVLLENKGFRATEKRQTKLISLIDWKWLLGLIVLSLSLEWLLRKYRGLI